MKILFVYGSLDTVGGIETLIIRFARYLHEHGCKVTILLQNRTNDNPSPLLQEVKRYAAVYHVDGWFRSASPSLRKLPLYDFDYIYAFESCSLVLAHLIQTEMIP